MKSTEKGEKRKQNQKKNKKMHSKFESVWWQSWMQALQGTTKTLMSTMIIKPIKFHKKFHLDFVDRELWHYTSPKRPYKITTEHFVLSFFLMWTPGHFQTTAKKSDCWTWTLDIWNNGHTTKPKKPRKKNMLNSSIYRIQNHINK